MTWDVYAVRAMGARSVEQIPDAHTRPDIGDADHVLNVVRRIAPDVDATDPRWLRIEGPDHRIEIALGNDVRVHDLSFYIYQGDGAVPVVLDICGSLGITPFDTDTGGILTSHSTRPADAPLDEDDEDDDEARPWWRKLLGR
jgi:hypothetical protein